MSAAEWQPGDPLYAQASNGGAGYRTHLFNFRDDSRTEECHCPDSASWPKSRTPLDDRDEIGELIDAVRRDREIEARRGA